MKIRNLIALSLLLVMVMIICCSCGSSEKQQDDPSETAGQQETTETAANAHTERKDSDNGEYIIYNYDDQGNIVQITKYAADDTIISDTSYDPQVSQREISNYSVTYTSNTGDKNECWIEYKYTPDSPIVTVLWKKIIYVGEGSSNPQGEYIGTAQVEYEMQDPNNRILFSMPVCGYDKDQFLLVPKEYSITEFGQSEPVASEQFKYEEQNSEAQNGDESVLKGTVSIISYDEAVELQGYPDYNEADTGQTWVIVTLDSPQRLKGTQDVDTWEKEYSVILVWTQKSSGFESGEKTLSDYIGKHITFTAGSFSKASDTSVPMGVPWAHDITVIDCD